jgi:hypothetical protein
MSHDEKILIRTSTTADVPGLARLAALDSAETPHGRVLIAEVDGSMRAAMPLDGGRPIADPFAESVHVLELLAAHARALPAASGAPAKRGRLRGRGRLVPAAA